MARSSPFTQNIVTGFLFVSITLLIGFLSWLSISVMELRDRTIVIEVRQDKMQMQVDTVVKEMLFIMHGNAPR